MSDLKRELTKAEGDVEQVRSRATRDQSRLDGGQVGAKDAQALVGELASLARRQEVLEEVELGIMERLEAHEEALAKLDSANDELVAAKREVEVERDAQLAEVDAEVVSVTAARAKASEGLDAAWSPSTTGCAPSSADWAPQRSTGVAARVAVSSSTLRRRSDQGQGSGAGRALRGVLAHPGATRRLSLEPCVTARPRPRGRVSPSVDR
ncbi:hypothetical protein NKG05_25575 [Oerskovia sp. M15]